MKSRQILMFIKTVYLTIPLLALLTSNVYAQSVILDKQVRAGNLVLMQSVNNENDYFYVPNQAHLAEHPNGTKQFSFLQYIEPNVSADQDNSKGSGGGIVHAVVTMEVSERSINQARNDLRRINSNGRIVGPVTFSAGTFSLISSFAKEGSEFTDTLIGVGPAALIDGSSMAISMKLTAKGSEVLRQSFETRTPDISFSFEMDIDGYLSPQQAILEANFDKIYAHKNFAAGIATPYLQAEINTTFDDLRNSGAIKLTQIGGDADMEKLITTAYDKLTKIVFDSAGTTGSNDLLALAGNQETSMLDKASGLLKSSRDEVRKENDDIAARNDKRAEREAKAAENAGELAELQEQRGGHRQDAHNANTRGDRYREQAAKYRELAEEMEDDEEKQRALTSATGLEALAAKEDEKASQAESSATALDEDLGTARQEANKSQADLGEGDRKEYEKKKSLPSLAIVASYTMKTVKQSGEFRIDLNKYSASTIKHRFDENIGDLTDELDNEDVFRTVDLSGSAFAQRELPVYIDGLNIEDFGKYINFVTVLMRKRHENGAESTDELKIDRDTFQLKANNFKLSYRKLSDSNNAKFLEYDYKVIWNFFGGAEVDQGWTSSVGSGIPLSPPYEKRSIFLEAGAQPLSDAGVRSMEFKLYFDLGGREQVKRLSLRPDTNGTVSQQVEFMLPKSKYEYDYEVSWRLNGNQRRNLERSSSEDGTIFLDEIPGA